MHRPLVEEIFFAASLNWRGNVLLQEKILRNTFSLSDLHPHRFIEQVNPLLPPPILRSISFYSLSWISILFLYLWKISYLNFLSDQYGVSKLLMTILECNCEYSAGRSSRLSRSLHYAVSRVPLLSQEVGTPGTRQTPDLDPISDPH